MKTVSKNKKLFGVCKNGTIYGNPNASVVNLHEFINYRNYTNMKTKLRTGYQTTIKISATNNFKLYQIINNELVQVQSDVANKLIVVGAAYSTPYTRESVLTYNGDGTFSIGGYGFSYPRDAKLTVILASEIYVAILDSNDNPFYTNVNLFSFDVPTNDSDFQNYKIDTYSASTIERTIKNIDIEIDNELDLSLENGLNGEYEVGTIAYYQTLWGPGTALAATLRYSDGRLTLKSIYK